MSQPYFHIGILVEDIDAAAKAYGNTLGLAFRTPVAFPLTTVEQPGVTETGQEVLVSYSVAGPPYYELIQANGSGLYSREQGFGMHHVGLWMDDPDEVFATLSAQSIEVAAINRMPDGHIITIFTKPNWPGGVRLEYVNSRFKPLVENFLATGVFAAP